MRKNFVTILHIASGPPLAWGGTMSTMLSWSQVDALSASYRSSPRLSESTSCHGRRQFLLWRQYEFGFSLCKLIHHEDDLFRASQFTHRLPECLVADESVVDAVIFLLSASLLKLICRVALFASKCFPTPVTVWPALPYVEVRDGEQIQHGWGVLLVFGRIIFHNMSTCTVHNSCTPMLKACFALTSGSTSIISHNSVFPAAIIASSDSLLKGLNARCCWRSRLSVRIKKCRFSSTMPSMNIHLLNTFISYRSIETWHRVKTFPLSSHTVNIFRSIDDLRILFPNPKNGTTSALCLKSSPYFLIGLFFLPKLRVDRNSLHLSIHFGCFFFFFERRRLSRIVPSFMRVGQLFWRCLSPDLPEIQFFVSVHRFWLVGLALVIGGPSLEAVFLPSFRHDTYHFSLFGLRERSFKRLPGCRKTHDVE